MTFYDTVPESSVPLYVYVNNKYNRYRTTNIEPALVQRLVFAGYTHVTMSILMASC